MPLGSLRRDGDVAVRGGYLSEYSGEGGYTVVMIRGEKGLSEEEVDCLL
jgi:hypothetical protein